jgi:flagellar motor switch protein FliM
VVDILSPEEIEALLTSLATDAAGDSAAEAEQEPQGAPSRTGGARSFGAHESKRSNVSFELYDFRRPDKLSKDQLRKLHMLHETFARATSSALASYIRAPVQVELISVEQVPYEEYLRSINQSVFSILSLSPLSGQAVLEMEFSLMFTMIDRVLGGPGKAISRTSLTDIELPLCRQLLERILGALKSAWDPVVIVNPDVEVIETSSQFVQIATPNDIAVTILFELKVGAQRGAMSLCIPYLVLKPITQKLGAQKWITTTHRKRTDETRGVLSRQICQTSVPCHVELGTARLSIGEFLNLHIGDVLRLDQNREQDLKMHVVNTPRFAGRPALRGNKVVFKVTESI